jgi:hypothetical protein
MGLTRDDYMSAIRAVEKQMADGSIKPYHGAMSPFMAKPKPKIVADPIVTIDKPRETKKRTIRKRKTQKDN